MSTLLSERRSAGAVVRARVAGHGRAAEGSSHGRLLRVRSPLNGVVYLLERPIGPWRSDWVVYADGVGRQAARQHVCPTLAVALARISDELGEG